MADLIPPHGGLSEPVFRTVSNDEIANFKAAAESLPKVPVSSADVSTVYRLGDGTLSPLTGPMNSATYHRVLDESVIENNGKLYAWTVPISFPLTADLAKTIKAGQQVALTNPAGEVIATVEVNDVFPWPKLKYLRSGYLTDRVDPPGADMVLNGGVGKSHLIRGEVVRMATYEHLITERFLGDGDSDASLWTPRKEAVPDRVILLGLDIKMLYGGPKEAVMHGIYRQNMGYTHIVIGRKHADAPYANGEAIWGDFDAQEIF